MDAADADFPPAKIVRKGPQPQPFPESPHSTSTLTLEEEEKVDETTAY